MTIKQYGGVFGRNPTFNEIDSDGNANLGDGALFVDSVNKRVGIDKTNPQYPLDFNTAATGMVARFGDDNVNSYVSFSNPRAFFGYHTGNAMVQSGAGKKIIFYTGSGTVGDAAAVAAEFTTSGNLAFPSGQGIDFSATAGTGTSELLDDYEIGQWTPTYTTTGTDFDSITYNFQHGEYVKIGQMVWVSFQFRTTAVTVGSASGNLRIGGLPFTVGTQSAGDTFGPVGTFKSFASGNPQVVSPVNGTTQMQVVSQDSTIQDYSIIGTGSNANSLQGNIIYLVN